MIRSILVGVLCGISAITASPVLRKRDFPDPEPCTGNCSWIHDPNIYKDSNTYYRFSTSGNIAIATAPSLTGPWEYKGALLDNGTKIIVDPHGQDIWAPNIAKIGDMFYAYYSVSTMGSQASQIGVATSSKLDPGTWIDHGSFGLPHSQNYNLIDPAIFQDSDNGPLFLTFGSYWNGIYQTPLETTDLISYSSGGGASLTNIVRNTTVGMDVVEGAIMFKWQTKYYVFFSAGNCCAAPPNLPAPGREYRVMVCRADQVTGPFKDKDGKDCLESGGTLVLGSHGDVYAPGGQGVMVDEGKPVMYYHYVKPSVGYAADQFFFGFNYLDFSSGWPVVV